MDPKIPSSPFTHSLPLPLSLSPSLYLSSQSNVSFNVFSHQIYQCYPVDYTHQKDESWKGLEMKRIHSHLLSRSWSMMMILKVPLFPIQGSWHHQRPEMTVCYTHRVEDLVVMMVVMMVEGMSHHEEGEIEEQLMFSMYLKAMYKRCKLAIMRYHQLYDTPTTIEAVTPIEIVVQPLGEALEERTSFPP